MKSDRSDCTRAEFKATSLLPKYVFFREEAFRSVFDFVMTLFRF